MKDKLLKLIDNSIAPQDFAKSAAIVYMKDGSFSTGVSIKNDIYRDSISAEASAISRAIVKSYKKGDFEEIYIYFDSDNFEEAKYFNREMIHEFFDEDSLIYLLNRNSEKVLIVKDIYKEFLWNVDM